MYGFNNAKPDTRISLLNPLIPVLDEQWDRITIWGETRGFSSAGPNGFYQEEFDHSCLGICG